MSQSPLALHVPEDIYERVRRAAKGMKQPMEKALVNIVKAATPSLEKVPLAYRAELRRTATDPITGRRVRLFHPRWQRWSEHFHWEEVVVVPVTALGRATPSALRLNRPLALAIRREEVARGRHPPPV